MAIHHAASGELIDVQPLGERLGRSTSTTLVRENHLEIFRLVLKAGKAAPDHKVSGAITIQCLEGVAELDANGRTQLLKAGSLVYLSDGVPHAVRALEDTSLLITMLLKRS